jgi:hypothetical protein
MPLPQKRFEWANPKNTAKTIGGIPRGGWGEDERIRKKAKVIGEEPRQKYVLKRKNGRDIYDVEVR